MERLRSGIAICPVTGSFSVDSLRYDLLYIDLVCIDIVWSIMFVSILLYINHVIVRQSQVVCQIDTSIVVCRV